MNSDKLPVRQRILSSVLFAFAAQFLAALFLALIFKHTAGQNWIKVFTVCTVYAVATTIMVQIYVKKYRQSLGLSKKSQLFTLGQAIKTNTLPTDKVLLNALPAYLDRQIKTIDTSRKSFKLNVAVFAIMLLLSITTGRWFTSIFFGSVLALLAFSNFTILPRKQKQIEDLRKKLDKQGIRTDEATAKKSSDWQRVGLRAKTAIKILNVVGLSFLILLIALTVYARNMVTQLPYKLTSEEYGFSLNLPNKPIEYNVKPQIIVDQQIDIASYASYKIGTAQTYGVMAYRWPENATASTLSQSEIKTRLHQSVETSAKSTNQRIVKTEEKYILSDSTLAVESTVVRKGVDGTYTGYTRIFMIANLKYVIYSQDINKASFEHFADSFQYEGKGYPLLPDNPVVSPGSPRQQKIDSVKYRPDPIQGSPETSQPFDGCGEGAIARVGDTCQYGDGL